MARTISVARNHRAAAATQAKIPEIRSRFTDGGTGGLAVRLALRKPAPRKSRTPISAMNAMLRGTFRCSTYGTAMNATGMISAIAYQPTASGEKALLSAPRVSSRYRPNSQSPKPHRIEAW